jgi:multicomponent K+:H+ antiporter subunit D
MTKVGAYAIIRIYTLIFGADGGPAAEVAAPWLLPASAIGLVIGALGVLASRVLVNLVSFSMIWSMGSLLLAVGLFDAGGWLRRFITPCIPPLLPPRFFSSRSS